MTILLITLALIVVALAALWVYTTAHRLDRLHVRLDAAWLALEAALSRRAVVARSIAGTSPEAERRLATLAAAAERSNRDRREAAENALSAALERVPFERLSPQQAGELADAQTRVLLARRFHNDAVRDTLALRSRRPVRWLRLGGTAAQPQYFEIAEAVPADPARPPRRPAVRVLLVDEHGRVLMLQGADPGEPGRRYWITTGGGVEPGESLDDAAVRELAEETGLRLAPEQLRGPLWWRRFPLDYDGRRIEAEETYFAAAVEGFEPVRAGFTELEVRTLTDFRWCHAAQLAELDAAGETVYPPRLAELLPEVLTAVQAPPGVAQPTARRID